MTETVAVVAGGQRFTLWKSVTIQYGATQAARAASLQTADPWTTFGGGSWPLQPGTDVQIFAGGALLVSGFVESFDPSVSGTTHEVSVTITSKSKDAIEASADHPSGEIRGKRIVEIAREIDPTGTDWRGSVGEPIAVFRVRPGEKVFDAVERAARGQGVLLVGHEDGGVEAIKGIRGAHTGSIREGAFTNGSSRLSIEGRHSQVKVRGQSGEDLTRRGQQPEAVAAVPLPRPRPLIVVHPGEATSAQIRAHAEWIARRQAGWSIRASVTLPRWRDDGGRLWEPAFTVPLISRFLRIEQEMVIVSVSLTQGDGGTQATLELADPRAIGGGAPTASQSDRAYSVPVPKVRETPLR